MFEIGTSLREARERRRITIAQAEGATKVRGKYLRALEEEQFDQLPAGTYVRGFLRTYADYLGLDGQLYVDEYNSRFVTGNGDLRPRRSSARPEPRNHRLERNIVLIALVLVAIVTVVVITAWKSSGSSRAAPKAHHAARKALPVRRHVVAAPGPYLTLRAVGGSSYVAVRRGGPAGAVLFDGTIPRGHFEPFRGKRFWVNVSAPENLVIKVGGKRIVVAGYKPQVITVTPQGWHLG